MPRVDLRDAFGTSYQVATMDLELLERWFREWLPRLYPPELAEQYGEPAIIVWPLFDAERVPDWPASSTATYIEPFTRDPGQAMAVLEDMRKRIEKDVSVQLEVASDGG